MTTDLRSRNTSQWLYVHGLSTVWRVATQLWDTSLWLHKEPEIEEKMLRDGDIAHAVGYRQSQIAGRQWDLIAKDSRSDAGKMSVEVCGELLDRLPRFTEGRRNLSRAFFSGQRYATVHGEFRKLKIGDGKLRTWWVPCRLEDHDRRRFRKVPDHNTQGKLVGAHWEMWNVTESRFDPLTLSRSMQTIRHTYQDDEAHLGYGRALREALAWLWYAKTQIFTENLQFIERFAQGLLNAKVDGARDTESDLPNQTVIDNWTELLENLRARHVLVTDKDDSLEILHPSGTGHAVFKDSLEMLRNSIYTLVIGSNLSTNASEGGSYALGKVQENSSETLIQFDRESLEETITGSLLKCIWTKNAINIGELGITDSMPRFAIKQEKRHDPAQRIQIATQLNQMGVPLAADDLYEQTGFRKPDEGDEVIEGQQAPQGQPGGFPFQRVPEIDASVPQLASVPSFPADGNGQLYMPFFDESKVKRDKGRFATKEGAGGESGSESAISDSRPEWEGQPHVESGAKNKPTGRIPDDGYAADYDGWAGKLSRKEKKALGQWSLGAYSQIKAVQRGQAVADKATAGLMRDMESALSSAPSKQGTFYRGMALPQAAVAALQPGKIVSGKTYSSWSDNVDLATEFATSAGEGQVPVLFKGDLRSAKDVSAFSKIPEEQESLTSAGVGLVISSVEEQEFTDPSGAKRTMLVVTGKEQ